MEHLYDMVAVGFVLVFYGYFPDCLFGNRGNYISGPTKFLDTFQ